MEQKPSSFSRLRIVHGFLVLFALALVTKAAYEQLYRRNYWTRLGQRQHFASSGLPAPRGEIVDATGEVLVESRELTHVSIAPHEVKNPAAVTAALKSLGVDPKLIAAMHDPARKWIDIPQSFLPSDVASLVTQHGVYARPVMDRVYATSGGLRRILGRMDPQTDKPLDGVELALDSVLRGDTAIVRVARDKSGRPLAAAGDSPGHEPGNTVVLTINRELQEICDRSLASAVDSLHASGGDIVVMNPHTGEVLALASNRSDPAAIANTALTEPYEPGSTMKPFMAARLIQLGRAKPEETIDTYGGHLEIQGRKIDDAEEHAAIMTLSDVIKHSSNVGIVRFGERMTPREKYELMRDAGFGMPTALGLPAESPGTVRDPSKWSLQSEASVAMGYEVAVTPLQIVAAYSAIANGGMLPAPQIVKEIRGADGTVKYTDSPHYVRRVMTPEVAATMRQMLRDVVSGGTSTKADLATLDVAGKSGTAKRNEHGHYLAGKYTASFVGLFPEDNPQYVVLVKLDDPQNGFFGGVVAGGVTNVVLRAAFAARDAALDRGTLAQSVHAPRPDTTAAGRVALRLHADSAAKRDSLERKDSTTRVVARAAPADSDPRTGASYVVKLPASIKSAPPTSLPRAVPDVSGLSLRDAVRELHASGFRVELVNGNMNGTEPTHGTMWEQGRVVKIGGGL